MGVVCKTVRVNLSPMEQSSLRKHVENFSDFFGVSFSEEEVLATLLRNAIRSSLIFNSEEEKNV